MAAASFKYALVLFWAFISFAAAMLCFYQGFFLQRKALTTKSLNCPLPPGPPHCQFPGMPLCTAPQKAQFEKLVLIIVDALRYDFLDPNGSIYPQESVPIAKQLADNFPANAVIGKLIADPPTTTMQRVKALMTGTFPTFIDAGSNFFSYAVEEDSLVHQWRTAGKSVAFVGDDTWVEMFPDAFDEELPCPSFDIMDLDSVDNVVRERLFKEFNMTETNASSSVRHDVIIGHFLGVDHAGHRHGRGHPEMVRKLKEVNAFLERIIDALDDETLLVVLGDHGMTSTGDHGGDTDDEVDAGLMLYSKKDIFRTAKKPLIASQIDLVPTLAWLTGVAIPLSNVGTVIWDLMPHEEDRVNAAAANYLQVKAFLENYPLVGFPAEEKKTLKRLGDQIEAVACEEGLQSQLMNETVTEWRRNYLDLAKRMCRKAWVDFDTLAMTNGLVFALLALSSWSAVCLVPASKLSSVFPPALLVLLFLGTGGVLAAGISVQITHWFPDNWAWSAIFATTCGTQALVLSNVVKSGQVSCSVIKNTVKASAPPILALILYCCSYASNSFVINEDSVTLFLLVTFVFLDTVTQDGQIVTSYLLHCLKTKENKPTKLKSRRNFITVWNNPLTKRFVLAMALAMLARTSTIVFRRCREENLAWCEHWITHKPTNGLQSDSERRSRFLLACATMLFTTAASAFQMRVKDAPDSFASIVINYFPWFNCFFTACYWCSFCLPKKDLKAVNGTVYLFPGVVFALSIAGAVVVVCSRQRRSNTSILSVLSLLLFQCAAIFVSDTYVMPFAAFFLCLQLLVGFSAGLSMSGQRVVTVALLASVFFFATGHQASFVALQWESAFIFGPLSNNVVSALSVIVNTYSVYLLAIFSIPLLVISSSWDEEASFPEVMFKSTAAFLVFFQLRLYGCAVAAAVLKRHLMVWKIFGPRFLFEFVGFTVVGLMATVVTVFAGIVVKKGSWRWETRFGKEKKLP